MDRKTKLLIFYFFSLCFYLVMLPFAGPYMFENYGLMALASLPVAAAIFPFSFMAAVYFGFRGIRTHMAKRKVEPVEEI